MFSLAQRDAVVKSLKKELGTTKGFLQKAKQKCKDLKLQLQNQENINQQNSSKVRRPTANYGGVSVNLTKSSIR